MKKLMLYFSALDVFQEPDEKMVSAILEASIDAIEFCRKYAEDRGFEVSDIYTVLPFKDEIVNNVSGYGKFRTVDYHDVYMKAFEKALENIDVVVIIPALKRGSGIPKDEKKLCFDKLVNVRNWNDMFSGGHDLREHIKRYIADVRSKEEEIAKAKAKSARRQEERERELVQERIRIKSHSGRGM